MAFDTKEDVLRYYKQRQSSYGRDEAISHLKINIKYQQDKKNAVGMRWRQEILEEYFGESWLPVMAKIDGVAADAAYTDLAPTLDWDQQLADLLSPTTPIYITE